MHVNHLSATQPRSLGPRESLVNPQCHTPASHCLITSSHRELTTAWEVVLILKTLEQGVQVPGPTSSHPPPPSAPINSC